jgi:hypothetical protein
LKIIGYGGEILRSRGGVLVQMEKANMRKKLEKKRKKNVPERAGIEKKRMDIINNIYVESPVHPRLYRKLTKEGKKAK